MPALHASEIHHLRLGVTHIHAVVTELTAKGVQFLRLDSMPQDEQGIWQAPRGAAIAWFKDPDGNTLSVSQHPG